MDNKRLYRYGRDSKLLENKSQIGFVVTLFIGGFLFYLGYVFKNYSIYLYLAGAVFIILAILHMVNIQKSREHYFDFRRKSGFLVYNE